MAQWVVSQLRMPMLRFNSWQDISVLSKNKRADLFSGFGTWHTVIFHYFRGLCRGNLDHENKLERFNAFLESEKCEMDKRLPYALASSLNKWTESWPDLEGNATCVNNPLPINFNPFFYINSFVSTLTHITAFYPEW